MWARFLSTLICAHSLVGRTPTDLWPTIVVPPRAVFCPLSQSATFSPSTTNLAYRPTTVQRLGILPNSFQIIFAPLRWVTASSRRNRFGPWPCCSPMRATEHSQFLATASNFILLYVNGHYRLCVVGTHGASAWLRCQIYTTHGLHRNSRTIRVRTPHTCARRYLRLPRLPFNASLYDVLQSYAPCFAIRLTNLSLSFLRNVLPFSTLLRTASHCCPLPSYSRALFTWWRFNFKGASASITTRITVAFSQHILPCDANASSPIFSKRYKWNRSGEIFAGHELVDIFPNLAHIFYLATKRCKDHCAYAVVIVVLQYLGIFINTMEFACILRCSIARLLD